MSATAPTSHTCPITAEQAETLRAILVEQDWVFRDVPYARFAAAKGKVNVVAYESGKLVVQGKDTADFITFTLEPLVLKEAKLGYETVLKPELLDPRLGVDESGKGDFFGPLCVAGVYVNAKVLHSWEGAGVRDSKHITSDRKMLELADLITSTPGCVTSVVPIGNESYNRLYSKFKSVNRLLAWGHARIIENLMEQRHRMNPPPIRAISDQFARDKDTVAKALMALGREIELVQRHRAEEDIAVAAASILARAEFVRRMQRLSKDVGVELPKGASAKVDEVAAFLFAKGGKDLLQRVAKMHFRTALRAQGLPEPEKVSWEQIKQRTKSKDEPNV